MANQQYDEKAPILTTVTVLPANGTSAVNLHPQNTTQPTRIDRIFVANTDSIDHMVAVKSGVFTISQVNIPAGAGMGTVALVELLSVIGPNGLLPYIIVPVQGLLTGNCLVAVQTGQAVTFITMGGTL